MDNELEIVKNDGLTTEVAGNNVASQYIPIAAGFASGVVAGALLYKFALAPLFAKMKAKRAQKKEEAPKTES